MTATAAPNRDDTLYDSAGNDRIESGDGGDHIYATRGGNDYINAGAGQDKATGGSGNDVIVGGTENDILEGRVGDDRLYADSQISVATAIADGNIADSGSGRKGDWLAGESGDDTLIGDASNDVLSGGGTDLLIGGAGDDDILGDTDWVATSFDWTVTDQEGVRWFNPVIGTQFPGDGAADVIYAGEGNDHAWDGLGNDVIFGGMGNDTIRGGTGRDTYLYSKGDGIDNIWDDDIGPEKSVLMFGEGVDKNAITLRTGSLLLDMGNGDAIHIENFDQAHPLARQSFAAFQFADSTQKVPLGDGTSLSWEELLQHGFDLDGTDGDDISVEDSERYLDTRESRRWWDGGRRLRAANDAAWRRAA